MIDREFEDAGDIHAWYARHWTPRPPPGRLLTLPVIRKVIQPYGLIVPPPPMVDIRAIVMAEPLISRKES